MNRPGSGFYKKIVILGYDGLSPLIIEKMMAAGELPNFSRLAETGSYRRLATTNPPQSPVAWSGFSTGRNPGKHGVFDFIVRDPATYKLDLVFSKMANARPARVINGDCFWNYTSKERVPTTVICAPVTFPPDEVYGRMLSGMGVPDILGTEGTFTFYTTEEPGKGKDIGGRVYRVRKAPEVIVDLIGPRVATARGADNVKVPVRVTLKGAGKATVEYQGKKAELEAGKWSDWQEVT